jgi:hypothetical protein
MMTPAFEITRQALDSGKITHTGWTPSRDIADQCGVNVVDYFDASGKFLGPDENGLVPTFAEVPAEPFSVQWEFMGGATQEHFDAAQAVADAMESARSLEITNDVIESACDNLNMDLGTDWDYKSVLAMIENCSFERIDQEASADA